MACRTLEFANMTKILLQKEEYGKNHQQKPVSSLLFTPVSELHKGDLSLFSFLNQTENMEKLPPHIKFARNQNRSCGPFLKND